MIAFVIVTAFMNIALGYGLAVYVGHGCLPWRRRVQGERPVDAGAVITTLIDEPVLELPDEPATPEPVVEVPPSPFINPIAEPVATPAADPVAIIEPAVELPGIEQEMLAGIEEFRNQLAQMKAQVPDGEGLAEVEQMARA